MSEKASGLVIQISGEPIMLLSLKNQLKMTIKKIKKPIAKLKLIVSKGSYLKSKICQPESASIRRTCFRFS